ncbi:hypothetical protein [Paraburkholderia hospita]|uniref:hypothetical protein n=1 Tax=Paraburkholderia hospita TaxID=169430 RepID=UPI000B342163|nr:hypothetical protein [Paraburkholderia hospita]
MNMVAAYNDVDMRTSSSKRGKNSTTSKRSRRSETDRTLAFALVDVASEFARLLGRYWTRHKRMLQKRGARIAVQDVKDLLLKAFMSTLTAPRHNHRKASKRRDALLYVLAAASVPPHLAKSGIPHEMKRARQRRSGQ